MTDIVERLRQRSMCVHIAMDSGPADDVSAHLKEAADEIERLREALQIIYDDQQLAPELVEVARAALQKDEGK